MHVTSGLLANYDIVVCDYDIRIYQYRLRCRSSMKATTISCITRYRVLHDIGNYDIVFHDIVYRVLHDVVKHDIGSDVCIYRYGLDRDAISGAISCTI